MEASPTPGPAGARLFAEDIGRVLLSGHEGGDSGDLTLPSRQAGCAVKLAKPAVIGLIVLSLAGCTAATTRAPTGSAGPNSSSAPTRSAAPDSSSADVSAMPATVDKLPTSCEALYSGLNEFMSDGGSLVLNPAWRSGSGAPRTDYGTYDADLAGMLAKNPELICDWAPATRWNFSRHSNQSSLRC